MTCSLGPLQPLFQAPGRLVLRIHEVISHLILTVTRRGPVLKLIFFVLYNASYSRCFYALYTTI